MASKKFKVRIRFYFTVIGFGLALCIHIPCVFAFTAPSVKDIPSSIQVNGKQVSLQNLNSPVAKSEQAFKEGAKIYIQNCALCHGDLLDGKGLYGESFFPRPANFLHPQSSLSKPQS